MLCIIKVQEADECRPVHEENSKMKRGFPRRTPALKNKPPSIVFCPLRKLEVTKSIETEQGRIKDNEKITELYMLCEDVFRSRSESFHWNLNKCVGWQDSIK